MAKLTWLDEVRAVRVGRIVSSVLHQNPTWIAQEADEADEARWRADAKAALLEHFKDVKVSRTSAWDAGCCKSGIVTFASDAKREQGVVTKKGRRYPIGEVAKVVSRMPSNYGWSTGVWRAIGHAIMRQHPEVLEALDINNGRTYQEERESVRQWLQGLIDTASPARVQEENGVY